MTAPASHGPERWWRRRTARILVVAVVLGMLLAPVVFLFGQLWNSTGYAIGSAATERAAVAYARPLDKLLAALVDAQYAAVRGTPVDAAAVRAAVDEVDGVDRRSGDVLRVRTRWTGLIREIDNTLSQNPHGARALRVYGAPVSLAQALFDHIADASKRAAGPGSGVDHLLEIALQRLPDVVASAGQVAALAATPTGPAAMDGPQLAVAVDRLTRAAGDAGIGLRAGTDPAAGDAVDLRLLGFLDEFAAATDELTQIAAKLDGPGRDRVEAASARAKTAAFALGTAVLTAVDTRIAADVDRYDAQRWILVLAGVVIALAAALLLWLRVPGSAAPRTRASRDTAGGTPEGRSTHPDGDGAPPDGAERDLDLVDARTLLGPGLARVGSTRQDSDDSQ